MRTQHRNRRIAATIAVIGGLALGTGPALAASADLGPWYTTHMSPSQVVASHDALAAADQTCEIVTSVFSNWWAQVVGLTCGRGLNDARAALDVAYANGCAIDYQWRDGPLSYDTEYRYTPCP